MADFKSLDLWNVYCSPNLIEAYKTHSFMVFSPCSEIDRLQVHLKKLRLMEIKAQCMIQFLFSNYLVTQGSI
jgi:hypothetical protein